MNQASTVNTRELAHNLLTAIQSRGNHSSGFAYVKGNQTSLYKRPVPGSELPLHDLPRRSDAVILHTRFATQGSVKDNRNNHPILSPEGYISLVHNGVISNDWEFRGKDPNEFSGLPAVDTAVIPALIERDGVKDGVGVLEGYAAISWLDSRDKDSRLHVARLDYSPVAFTWLVDGSYVFASTKPLLAAALAATGLEHGHIFEMPEEQYVQVVGGVIMESEDEIKMLPDWWTRRQYASATAGHGTGDSVRPRGGYNQYGIGSSFGSFEDDDDSENDTPGDSSRSFEYNPATGMYDPVADDASEWDKDYRNPKRVTTNPSEIAMAMLPETNKKSEVWLANEDGELEYAYTVGEDNCVGFYLELEDGTLDYSRTLGELEKALADLSAMDIWENAPFPGADRAKRWTNFVVDMGHIGSVSNLNSWLADLGQIDQHESRGVYNLNYIRDGLADILLLNAI